MEKQGKKKERKEENKTTLQQKNYIQRLVVKWQNTKDQEKKT